MKENKKLMLKQIKVLSLIQILKKQKRTFYQRRSHVERELVLQPSGLYLQPAEFTVRAAPARCRGHYWCVYPWNGSGLVVEVNSITPGLCSVNMAQSEADAVGDYLALRWERHAPLIRAGASGREIELITLTCIQLHGRTGMTRLLRWTSGGTWACQAGFCHCDAYINCCSHGLFGCRWIWQQRGGDGGDTGQWPVYWWSASLITATKEVMWLGQFAFLKQDCRRFEKLWMDLNQSLTRGRARTDL